MKHGAGRKWRAPDLLTQDLVTYFLGFAETPFPMLFFGDSDFCGELFVVLGFFLVSTILFSTPLLMDSLLTGRDDNERCGSLRCSPGWMNHADTVPDSTSRSPVGGKIN